MAWFKKQSKQNGSDVRILEELKDVDPGLASRFREAAFGNTFRAISYVNTEDGALHRKQWRRAVHIPDQGWRVFEESQFVGEKDIDQKISAEGLTFLQAARRLALYEVLQSKNVTMTTPDAEEEKKRLGVVHVRSFCEREGLAFDAQGVPHPTLKGLVVTEGIFPETAHETALKAFQEKEKFMVAGSLPPLLHTTNEHDFAKAKQAIEHIGSVLACMEDIASDMTIKEGDSFKWAAFYLFALQNDQAIQWEKGNNFYGQIRRFLANTNEFLTKDPEIDVLTHRPIHLFKFVLLSAQAANMDVHVRKNRCEKHNGKLCTAKETKFLQESAQNALRAMGYTEGAEQTAYRLFCNYRNEYEAGKIIQPGKDLHLIANYLRGLKSDFERALGITNAAPAAEIADQGALMTRILLPPPNEP